MRTCNHCGQKAAEGSAFCGFCGQPLQPPHKSKDIKMWLFALVGLLAGVLCAIVLILFIKRNTNDSEVATTPTVVHIDTVKITTSKVETPSQNIPNTVESSVAASRTPQFDGTYSLSGDIRGEYFFVMNISINGTKVNGMYRVYNEANTDVRLSGSIDANGKMLLYESFPDGKRTGYYFTGSFSGGRYHGKYLSTKRRINMNFHAE